MKIPLIALHPFIFAFVAVLLSYLQVKTQVLPEETIPALILLEGFTAVCFIAFALVLRSWQKAATVSSCILILSFLYRAIATPIEEVWSATTSLPAPPAVPLLIFSIFVVSTVLTLLKERWRFGKKELTLKQASITSTLNFVSIMLLVLNTPALIAYELQEKPVCDQMSSHYQQPFANLHLATTAPKPDVYYFILDGFANTNTLKDYWQYDNNPDFLQILRDKGFYVVPKACSNYDRTQLSVASTMTMQHLDWVRENFAKSDSVTNGLWRVIGESPVLKIFKSLGYHIVNLASGSGATDCLLAADTNLRHPFFNHFATALMTLTPLGSINQQLPILRDLYAEMRLSPGTKLPEIASIASPKFVLIHTEIAHAPCIFTEDGTRLPLPPHLQTDWGTPTSYVGQIKFAQKQVIKWVTYLLERPGPKPIIILQSDHGPQLEMATKNDYFKERMRIINAIYLPGRQDQGLYETITPVNTFRVILNDYFNAQLPLVEDKVMCAPVYEREFDWQDVTTIVRP